MTDRTTDTVKIDGYHGHVYYTAETRALAEQLGRLSPARSASTPEP